MKMLFEPKKPKQRIILVSALDVILWAVLGIAFLLLDFVFRDILPAQDVAYIRMLMVASWIVVFIFTFALAFLREKA